MLRARVTRVPLAAGLVVLALPVLVPGLSASAANQSPAVTPGTPAQVAQAVSSAYRITKLTAATSKQLTLGYQDWPKTTYPSTQSCDGTLTPCVFGDTSSSKVVVLFGDSHALMWLPAIAPAATRAKDKLVLFWRDSCPVASVTSFALPWGSIGTAGDCDAFRSGAIKKIQQMRPRSIILAERTTLTYSEPKNVLFTKAQWQAALSWTIAQLKKGTSKIVMMQDLTWFNTDPRTCLAVFPSNIQRCAQSNPNTKNPGLQSAEVAATTATRTKYVKTIQWFCTTKCSPVVGNYITYVDHGHVCSTYAMYLSVVVGDALAAFLR